MSHTIANHRTAEETAKGSSCASPILKTRLRNWLAPSGGIRESIGRTVVRGMRRSRSGLRLGWQQLLRTAHLSFPESFPEEIARELQSGATDSYDVFCLPVCNWRDRLARPQQLMRRFAENGNRVFYVSHDFLLTSPLAVERFEKNAFGVQLPVDARCRVLEQVLSESDTNGMAEGIERIKKTANTRAAVCIVQHPFWTPLAERLRDRFGWPIVYDCMDDYDLLFRQGGLMLDREKRLQDSADLIVATSDLLYRKMLAPSRRVSLIRNAVEYDHFAQTSPATKQEDAYVVGFYGGIAHWFDSELVGRLAQLRPEWRFELIGNTFTADLRPLRHLPNIALLGEMPYAALPRAMAHWHVCMIPFLRNELTEATNPVKVYEMLAAGMPVVAVDLPELRPIAEAGLIELADDAEGFAQKIDKLLAEQTPERISERRRFARQNTWEERFREMARVIEPIVVHASQESDAGKPSHDCPIHGMPTVENRTAQELDVTPSATSISAIRTVDAGKCAIQEAKRLKISVALCTYNGARFLPAQLESIALQDRKPDELVICDDRSIDETMAIVRGFAAGCGFEVRAETNEQNLGSTGNFAKAVSLCRGDLIVLADQDDLWLPQKLNRLERLFTEEPELGFAFSDAELIDENDRPLPNRLWESLSFDARMQQKINGDQAVEVLVKRNVVTGACMAFRSSYRDLLLPISGKWVHDGWFALLIAAVAPCRAVAEPLIRYRQHGAQQIGAKKENIYGQFLRGKNQDRKHFETIADNYAAAFRRLADSHVPLREPDVLQRLHEKSEHFRAKAHMREPKTWRLPLIVHELLSIRYARYSRGWRSMAQDLFL